MAQASLLSRLVGQLQRFPPRLRLYWRQSIRQLPAFMVAVRVPEQRYAWLALAVTVLAAPGAAILAVLSVAPAGTFGAAGTMQQAMAASAEIVDRTQENTPVAPEQSTEPPSTPQSVALASVPAPETGSGGAATANAESLLNTPTAGAARATREGQTATAEQPTAPRSAFIPVSGQSLVPADTVNGETPLPTATPSFQQTVSKLTPDDCCVAYLWAADSDHVLYYDRRESGTAGTATAGTWSVNVETGEESLLTPLYGYFSSDRSTVAVPEPADRRMRIRELTTEEEWVLPNVPSRVLIGPRGEHIAFTLRPAERPLERGVVGRPPQGTARILGSIAIWIADLRGTGARAIRTLPGARIHDWLPDGSALLVTWRTIGRLETSLGLLDVKTGKVALQTIAPRLLSSRLSPDGEWVAYVAAFTGSAERDGLWVRHVHGDEARRLDIWGDYRWAPDSSSLIVLPPRPKGADGDRFWRAYVDGEPPMPMTDPDETPFAITNNSWELSPDGKRVVFASAADYSLWILQLQPT